MLGARDDATLAAGLAAWAGRLVPERGPTRIEGFARPASGWSNETLLVTFDWPDGCDEVVVRLPTRVPSFPVYDLGAQARVQSGLLDQGMPAARPLLLEHDPVWLGAPFLVMEKVAGRPIGEVAAFDPLLMDAGEQAQRSLHERFVDLLAAVHRLDWRSAGLSALRGGDLAGEVRWWRDYIDWAASGDPSPRLVRLAEQCESTRPPDGGGEDAALCWGDARLGNVLFDERWEVTALLDWELASIGPPEMDLAWHLVLEELTSSVLGLSVPGFLRRGELLERYEGLVGRPVRDLAWHEVFALLRAAAIYDRQARMAAELGSEYTGVEGAENPPLDFALARLESP